MRSGAKIRKMAAGRIVRMVSSNVTMVVPR